jgi:hypothetical protein
MKLLTGYLSFLYAKCVRFYPTNFRLEFEEEMCEVFTKALTEAKERHFRVVIAFVLREFWDFPKILVSEHWSHLEESIRGATLQKLQGNPANTPAQMTRSNWMNEMDKNGILNLHSRWQQILSALPLFLFGLGISMISLTRGGPWHSVPTWRLTLSIVIGLLPMIVIATGGIIALIRRIPDWGLTWVGSAFMGLVIFVKTLAEELAEVGQRIISEPVEIGIVIALFLAGVALLVIVGMRGWQRGGLLSIGFSVIFTLTFFWAVTWAPFYRHDVAIWAGPFSLLIAAITYYYAKGTTLTRSMILMGVGILNIGSLLTANTIWQDWFQTKGETSSPLPFIIFMLAFLICGPIMGLITKPIQQTLRRA